MVRLIQTDRTKELLILEVHQERNGGHSEFY